MITLGWITLCAWLGIVLFLLLKSKIVLPKDEYRPHWRVQRDAEMQLAEFLLSKGAVMQQWEQMIQREWEDEDE